MSNDVTFTINGIEITAKSDKTILKAAEDNNIYIPRLCFRMMFIKVVTVNSAGSELMALNH